MKKIAIFASGSGSNAENIYEYFKTNKEVKITYILTNRKDAKVIERAQRLDIPFKYFTKEEFNSVEFVDFLKEQADLIVLAGFLLKIPESLTKAFENKMVNIHPALLPKYGGKGMYGDHVHKAVVANNETETGITIHYVNENYDEGAIIFQASTGVVPEDTYDTVADKVHQLEYKHFPEVIEQVLDNI